MVFGDFLKNSIRINMSKCSKEEELVQADLNGGGGFQRYFEVICPFLTIC